MGKLNYIKKSMSCCEKDIKCCDKNNMKNKGFLMPTIETNENKKILSEFKEKIKSIPIANRRKALAIYNIYVDLYAKDDLNESNIRNNLKTFTDSQTEITTRSDEIIEGKRKVNTTELESVNEFLNEGEEVKEQDNNGERINDFWLKSFKNKRFEISERDEPVLKHLINVEIIEKDDAENKNKRSTEINLTFEKNEFFNHDALS